MKPRKTLSVYVLLVGVMGLSIVGGILAFQIFSASIKSQLTAEEIAAVKPIDGTINQTVIDNLEGRKVITESELTTFTRPLPTSSTVPAVTPTVTLTASPSGEQATISGKPLSTQ